jgi:hypothetical protein
MKKLSLTILVVCVLFPLQLPAQDTQIKNGKFGLTFPNIGFIWHISDGIAFVPGINFNHNWSNYGISNTSGNGVAVNTSLRFYMPEWKNVRFYIAPKYGFSWTDSVSSFEEITGIISSSGTNYAHSISGAWGLQYAISNRISIFADIGAGYSRGTTSSSYLPSSDSHTNRIGTEGTWGLILYLK